jgi:putative DNA primase/helicase
LSPIVRILRADCPESIEGADRRFHDNGGLMINETRGVWYCCASASGGYSAVGLVRLLKNCSHTAAVEWVRLFLDQHAGTGSVDHIDDDHESLADGADALASRAQAEAIQDRCVEVGGTAGERYMLSRKIGPPYPATAWIEEAQPGVGGLVGTLTAHDRVVGFQLLYIDFDGQKSLVAPSRRRFMLEKAPEALFEMDYQGENQEVVLTEGFEDALSVYRYGTRRCRVAGMPGIATLRHLQFPRGTKVTICRDGDPPGSPPDKALAAGIDRLIFDGIEVLLTKTPLGFDANRVLCEEGVDALRRLLNEAEKAELSLAGEVQRLARLDAAEYDQQRQSIAKKLKIRVATLDKLVANARAGIKGDDDDWRDVDEDAPWEQPVDLGATLDRALIEVGRYIVAPELHLAVFVVWAAHTHVVHNPIARLQKSPRLAVSSRVKGSGKTTALEVTSCLSARGRMASSYTAASVMRGMAARQPTLCLDETDRLLKDDKSDLVAILNAGDRRSTAIVERAMQTSDGRWVVEDLNVWGAVAFAGIDDLPETLADRSVRILLRKASSIDVKDHLRDGISLELIELRRQLTAWGKQLIELPDPDLPEVLRRQAGRIGDNWRPLVAIADLAGGRWPKLIREAALASLVREEQLSILERLLIGIRAAFNAQPKDDNALDNRERIRTRTLIEHLLRDEGEEWGIANGGRVISPYWLRTQLRGLLSPPGSQDWWSGPTAHRVKHSGYQRIQFKDVWETHIPPETVDEAAATTRAEEADRPAPSPPTHSLASGASGASGNGEDFRHRESTNPAPDAEIAPDEVLVKSAPDAEAAPDGGFASGGTKPPAKPPFAPGAPDAPDLTEGVQGGNSATDPTPGKRGRRPSKLAEEVRDAYAGGQGGLSIKQLSKQFGQPPSIIRRLLGLR